MSGAHIAFYATAATAIPVFLVAYVVQMNSLPGVIFRALDALDARVRRSPEIREMEAHVSDSEAARAVMAAYDSAYDAVRQQILNGLTPLVLAAGALPMLGEACALITLSRGSVTHTLLVLTWIGLGTASVLALAPLWAVVASIWRPTYFPTIQLIRAWRTFQGDIARIQADARSKLSRPRDEGQ